MACGCQAILLNEDVMMMMTMMFIKWVYYCVINFATIKPVQGDYFNVFLFHPKL